MWHLYLDESGDLGFDFVNKKPSKFFTICILAVSSDEANRKLLKEAGITLRRKINSKRGVHLSELKATKTTIEIKKYLFQRIKGIRFGLYAITLNKQRLYTQLTRNKSRVYNFIARQVLDEIPFDKNDGQRVSLILDRCMGKPDIAEFNSYIRKQLEGRLALSIPLDIAHRPSHEDFCLQLTDLFAWGIFQKYERKNEEWHDIFRSKIRYDEQYL